MGVILLIIGLPAATGAAGLLFALVVRGNWPRVAFGLLAPSPIFLAAMRPDSGFDDRRLMLVGLYYALLAIAAFAGFSIARVLQRWWEGRVV